MASRRSLIVVAAASAVVALPGIALAAPAGPVAGAAATAGGHCSAGARTLSAPGARLYPETGNGGYHSSHTLVHLVYDAQANTFLPGTKVVLTDVATQCLTSFSLDFERLSRNKLAGPDMTITSVMVNGQPARSGFAQPTYPGDRRDPMTQPGGAPGLADERSAAHRTIRCQTCSPNCSPAAK
jgi:hypothetical protein